MYYGITFDGKIITSKEVPFDVPRFYQPVAWLNITRIDKNCTISYVKTNTYFRRRGYMITLFTHVISLLNPRYEINLIVEQHNWKAIKLYHKLGFEKIGKSELDEDYIKMKYKWKK